VSNNIISIKNNNKKEPRTTIDVGSTTSLCPTMLATHTKLNCITVEWPVCLIEREWGADKMVGEKSWQHHDDKNNHCLPWHDRKTIL